MMRRWFADNDTTFNILSRLPAKALHYVKYVSKDWFNLISDRSFIHFQLKRKQPVVGFFFQPLLIASSGSILTDGIRYVPVETENVNIWHTVLDFLPESVIILSSNNGLLCCRSEFPTFQPMIYICNPLNKQWISLQWHNLRKSSSIALAFDPSQTPVDASTDFKLVAVSDIEKDEFCFFFDIYSSKTGSWKRSKQWCPCDYRLSKDEGVFVEGNLYWLTAGHQVLMFDPEIELSRLIRAPLPATRSNANPEMCIGESEDKLNFVIISKDGLKLWVLEDQLSSQWGLKLSISLDDMVKENWDILNNVQDKVAILTCSRMYPLAFKDGLLLLRLPEYVYLYNFEGSRLKQLCDASILGSQTFFSPVVFPYVMSLVPLGQA